MRFSALKENILTQAKSAYSKFIYSKPFGAIFDPIKHNSKHERIIYIGGANLEGTIKSQYPDVSVEQDCIVSEKWNGVYDPKGKVIDGTELVRGQLGRKINVQPTIDCNALNSAERVDTAIFGGVLFPRHYGHLITESTARLWPFLDQKNEFYDEEIPVLFRMAGTNSSETLMSEMSQRLLESVGVYHRVRIVRKPTVVKNLIIPHAANSNAQYAFEVYRELLMTVGKRILNSPPGKTNNWKGKRVYLSRSRLSRQYRLTCNEEKLEDGLLKKGFYIVHPQEMGFKDQVKMFSEANEIVGLIGSAFHTMLLSQNKNMKLKYLVHDCPNDRFASSRTYQIFDKLRGLENPYIRCLYKHPLALKSRRDMALDVESALDAIFK